jgi:hypothetical protein
MQKIILFLFITLAFSSCSQQAQYGKSPLLLDKFNFNLDVASFFKDEHIFRGKSDFSVSASEETYDYKDSEIFCIQYSTRSMSKDRILAKYGGMDFESLGMITDSTDEKVLLVSASTDYGTAAKIEQVLKKLQQDYGTGTMSRNSFGDDGVKITFKTQDKVVKLVIDDIRIEQPEDNEDSDKDTRPFDERSKTNLIKAVQEKKDNISVLFFIATPEFDEVQNEARNSSGDLTHY